MINIFIMLMIVILVSYDKKISPKSSKKFVNVPCSMFFVQSFEYKRKLNFEAIDGMMFHKLISCMKSSLVDYHECICRKTKFNYICLFVCMFDGVQRHFQQYFSYIVAFSFIDGRKRRTRENHRPVASH